MGSDYGTEHLILTKPYAEGGSGGGSGSYNPNTGNTEYSFKLLSKIYGIKSNLNVAQKKRLSEVLNGFLDTQVGRMMYNRVVSENVKIDFISDPTIAHIAYYEPATKSIYIKNIEMLRGEQLEEEFIHAMQHQIYYGDSMKVELKNFEFEAKVFFDLAAIVNGSAKANFPTVTDGRPEFRAKYDAWIYDIEYNKNGQFKDINGYNSLCELWQGYPGNFDIKIQPEVLLYFFRKPIPPQPPLPNN